MTPCKLHLHGDTSRPIAPRRRPPTASGSSRTRTSARPALRPSMSHLIDGLRARRRPAQRTGPDGCSPVFPATPATHDRRSCRSLSFLSGSFPLDSMKRKTSMKPCCVYVDGDNQPSRLAGPLIAALAARGLTPHSVEIYGNDTTNRPKRWRDALAKDLSLGARVRLFSVPCHKEAADAALILALGAQLAEHVAHQHEVVIVSRDNALLACAERIQVLGCRALVCHAADAPAHWTVPTVTLQCGLPRAQGPLTGAPPPAIQRSRLLAMLRRRALTCPGGGYRKSCVGALLREEGMGRADRAAFLASVPGLRETAVAGDRALHF